MAQALSNPVVEISNVIVDVVANSVSYKGGRGDKTVKSQLSGGIATPVTTVDASTKIGMVKMKMLSTKANIDKIEAWLASNSGLAIGLSEGAFNKNFSNMTITNDPELALGVDSEIELDWQGSPAA